MPSLLETRALVMGAVLRADGARSVAALLRLTRGAAPKRRLRIYRTTSTPASAPRSVPSTR